MMNTVSNTAFTRRALLASGAAAATVLASTPGFAALGDTATEKSAACRTIHPQIGQQLAALCDSDHVDTATKNRALKATRCPHCAVQITPFGGSVGFVRL